VDDIDRDAAPRDPLDVVRAARGWHGVQLAVLAFIGLCGVLSNQDLIAPHWMRVTAGVLAVTALALACASIFLVASVAWPLWMHSYSEDSAAAGRDPARASGSRLRVGVGMTYVAVATMALAASANWWPVSRSSVEAPTVGEVQITDSTGNTACGELVDGPVGAIHLLTDDGVVELSISGLADVDPVASC
jgi:hypothetical protein